MSCRESMRRLGRASMLGLMAFGLCLAGQVPSATATGAPTYDLDGTWTASAIGCKGESEALGTVQITEWSASSGRFEAADINKSGGSTSSSGLESGSTVTLTILSAPGAKGLLPGQVFGSGSSLTMTLSIVCDSGASGSYTLVNRNPSTPTTPGTPQTELLMHEQERELSRSCDGAKGELLKHVTANTLGLSLEVDTPGELEATVSLAGAVSIARALPGPSAFGAAAGALECEMAFDASRAGSASVPRVRSAPAAAVNVEARAAARFTIAQLTQTFASAGRVELRIPLTRAGKSLIGKLTAADRAYRHQHPHGHNPPGARFKVMLRFTPGA